MLTLKQFNYLITIVEQGSFIAASEKLFIAQSALSRQIKLLEEDCGFVIFDRSEKKIKLTNAGQLLYNNLKNQMMHLDQIMQQAKDVARGKGRTLRIAHSSSIIIDQHNIRLLDHVSQMFELNLELVNLSSEHQIQALSNGNIDIGFIRPPVLHHLDEIHHYPIYQSRLFVAVNDQDTFFLNKESIAIAALKEQAFVSIPHIQRGGLSYLAANLCLSHGFEPKPARVCSRKIHQLDLVSYGFGISIVPKEFSSVLPKNVKLIALENESITSEVVLCCAKQADPLVKQCFDAFKAHFKYQSQE